MAERDMKVIVKEAVGALLYKEQAYNRLWKYYDGEHPLIFTSEKLKAIFRDHTAFSENWCQVVVDALNERISLTGFSYQDGEEQGKRLTEIFSDTRMELESDDVHLHTLVTGEAFVVVDYNEDQELEAFFNDPRAVVTCYNGRNPRQMEWAAKWWNDGVKVWLKVFFEDTIFTFWASSTAVKAMGLDATRDVFQQDGQPVDNQFKRIPVFHFRREVRRVKSVLTPGVLRLQNCTNKVLSDAMVTSEFMGFQQRWIIGNVDIREGQLRTMPGSTTVLPGAQTDVEQAVSTGAYPASEPTGMIAMIEHFADAMSGITGIPKHYFFRKGGDPSGEALIAMEASLTRKARKTIRCLGQTWIELIHFLNAESDALEVKKILPIWEPCETIQPQTQANTRQTNVAAGIPIVTLLRDEGWTEDDLKQLREDQMDDKVRTAGATTGPMASPAQQAITRGRVAEDATATAKPKIEDSIKNAVKGGVKEATPALRKASGQ